MTSHIELSFSLEAQQDIDEIQQYTIEQWGEEQLEKYQSGLYAAFLRLSTFPEIGRDLGNGVREFALRHHVVLYLYENESVTVLRVIHPRRLRDR